MSALRMVAYGVLDCGQTFRNLPIPEGQEDPQKEARKQRDAIRANVRGELREADLLIQQAVLQRGGGKSKLILCGVDDFTPK